MRDRSLRATMLLTWTFFYFKKTPILNPHLITWNREGHVAIATDGPPTTPMNPTPKQSNLTDIDDRSIVMTFAHVKPSGTNSLSSLLQGFASLY